MAKNDNAKLVAGLSYLLVGIIWYFVDETIKKDALVKFHVKQAINLWIINVCVHVVLTALIITAILVPVWGIFFLVLWLIGLVYGFTGQKKPVPLLGQFAEKYLKF